MTCGPPAPVAALAMYDWPALRAETDAFWRAIRAGLAARGIAAPETLDRGDPEAVWTDPGLVLAQTCGLPYATRLAGQVQLIATPDYGLPGCPPGHYRSVIVARSGDRRADLAAFRGAVVAVNGWGSQSGYAALIWATRGLAEGGRHFAGGIETGAHAASIRTVAEGAADLAAIDAQTWRLARRFEPEAAALRIVAETEPTPGLPLITGPAHAPAPIREALESALTALDPQVAERLGIRGFVAMTPANYAPLAGRLAAAEAAQRLERLRAG